MRWLLTLIYPAAVLGFYESLVLSVDYFRFRRVPYVCIVNCETNLYWSKEFTRLSSTHSIAVSSFVTQGEWQHTMQQCLLQRYTQIGVVLSSKCGVIQDVLFAASENMWFDSQHIWLIVDETSKNDADVQPMNYTDNFNANSSEPKTNTAEINDNTLVFNEKSVLNTTASENNASLSEANASASVVDILKHLNLSVDADMKLAVQRDKLYRLYDVFNFGKVQGGTLSVVDAGSWSIICGFSEDLNNYKYYSRWDFGQWPMRVVSVALVPPSDFDESMLTSVEPVPGVTAISRTSTIILMVVGEVHNIKFVHSITDRWIGSFEKNNTKIAANSLYFRTQDLTSVLRMVRNFTYKIGFICPALTSIETRYYYRIPTSGPGKYENQFLRPLSVGSWRSTVAIALICMLILVAAAKLEQRPWPVQYALFSVTANICQQFFEDDSQTTRSSTARKLTVFITGISCVLIYNYYTSSVVSWLLNGPPPSINSLEELLESPLELIYQDVGYTRTWLSNPGSYYYNKRNMDVEDKMRRKLSTKKESILKTLEEGIAMVKAGGYAYHTETDNADQLIAKTFTQSELCELGSIPSMEKTLLYPGVQKDSPYKEFLTWSLTRLLERGIVSCAQRRTAARTVSCEGSSPRALDLGSAAPAFIMLAFGFFVSTLIMLVERYIFKMRTARKPAP